MEYTLNRSKTRGQAHGDGTVVALSSLCPQHPCDDPLGQIVRYWGALHRAGQLPRRGDLAAGQIAHLLEHVFLIDRIAPDLARIRVAGKHLRDLTGTDPRGLPLTCLFATQDRAQVQALLRHLFGGPARIDLSLISGRGIGQPRLETRLLLLPLRDAEGRLSSALGGITATEHPGRPPRRFSLVSQSITPPTEAPHGATPTRGLHLVHSAG